jgi:hypothetical protein
MGDNEKRWAAELAERCRRVGFVVSETKDGYRVLGPDGQTEGWHRSQNNAIIRRKLLADLKRMGLQEREHKLASTGELQRRARIEEDRKANEVVAARVAKKATTSTLTKAAGEYAIHEDEAWPLRKHAHPACRLMMVTPQLAAKMLAYNTLNRKLRTRHTADLAEDMDADRFVLTHQGVAFDTAGVLLDGQHRLQAMIDANTTLVLFVFVGIDPRARAFIDVHARRSNADVLTMGGVAVPNVARVAAIVRTVLTFKREPTGDRWQQTRIDSAQVVEAYTADPDGFNLVARESGNARQARPGYSGSALGGVLYIARSKGASEDDIDEFWLKYKTGQDVGGGHPILTLRRQAELNAERSGHHIKTKLQFAHVLVAWNAFQEGRKLQTLKTVRLDDPLPPFTIRKNGA